MAQASRSVTVNVPMQVAGSTTQVEVTATGAPTNPDKTDLGATLGPARSDPATLAALLADLEALREPAPAAGDE